MVDDIDQAKTGSECEMIEDRRGGQSTLMIKMGQVPEPVALRLRKRLATGNLPVKYVQHAALLLTWVSQEALRTNKVQSRSIQRRESSK